MLNLMKDNLHLVKIDRLLARSWTYLINIDDLVQCSTKIHVELLDMLHIFTLKAPSDVSYSNSTVSVAGYALDVGNLVILHIVDWLTDEEEQDVL